MPASAMRSRAGAWSAGQLLVVLDIGKSNAKVVLLDPVRGVELAAVRRPNASIAAAPMLQLDIAGLQGWLLDVLASLPERHRIGAIVPVAHGAACVMLDAGGTAVLAPDYEDPALDEEDAAYDRARDPFGLSLSPRLPAGLNLGRQIHRVQTRCPELFARVATILTYAQYWTYLLCRVAASELTSLGCHTDLWRPVENRFSGLVQAQGWSGYFPALRGAAEVLGTVRPEIAARCGLPAGCAVLCGIHDSNASYLRHRMHRARSERFSVVSSGTWTVVMANGVPVEVLDARRDMLGNVDAFGAVVGTARFMGGREYLAVAGADPAVPTRRGLSRAVRAGAMVLPSLCTGGQFLGRQGRIVQADGLDREARAALATLYVALLADVALDLLQAGGDIVVDGPLAQNPLFPALLSALRPASAVLLSDGVAGSVSGARCLLLGAGAEFPALRRGAAAPGQPVPAERARWRAAIAAGQPA